MTLYELVNFMLEIIYSFSSGLKYLFIFIEKQKERRN
jgi:hypothetical protein